MLISPLHLIQSALGQKEEAKPAGRSCRERRQGWAARLSREVASLPGGMGLPLGQNRGRVSPLRTKSVFPASKAGGLVAVLAVSGVPTVLVLQAITSSIWNIHFTDEVPRCPGPWGRESAGYKPNAKGWHDAPVAGTVSPRPRLWGYQQRRSRHWRGRFGGPSCAERQNLRVPSGMSRFMGSVSRAIKATQWPGGTSSRQLVRNAKKQSPIAWPILAAVRAP